MFSRSSLVDVHLAYKIKSVVSKCSGVPSSVLANMLQGQSDITAVKSADSQREDDLVLVAALSTGRE